MAAQMRRRRRTFKGADGARGTEATAAAAETVAAAAACLLPPLLLGRRWRRRLRERPSAAATARPCSERGPLPAAAVGGDTRPRPKTAIGAACGRCSAAVRLLPRNVLAAAAAADDDPAAGSYSAARTGYRCVAVPPSLPLLLPLPLLPLLPPSPPPLRGFCALCTRRTVGVRFSSRGRYAIDPSETGQKFAVRAVTLREYYARATMASIRGRRFQGRSEYRGLRGEDGERFFARGYYTVSRLSTSLDFGS